MSFWDKQWKSSWIQPSNTILIIKHDRYMYVTGDRSLFSIIAIEIIVTVSWYAFDAKITLLLAISFYAEFF